MAAKVSKRYGDYLLSTSFVGNATRAVQCVHGIL